MATDGQAGLTRVNAFDVGDTLLFTHYFEEEAVFEKLKPYYERYDRRFAVPSGRLPEIRDFLRGRGYELVTVEDPDEYAVAVRTFSEHPEVVFEESVLETGTKQFNIFLLQDQEAVARAVGNGARPLTDTELSLDLG
jgi:hypothetical protein